MTDFGKSLVFALNTIVRIIENASFFFWLAVAAATLLLLDHYTGYSVSRLPADIWSIIVAVLIVLICLWLNALGLHLYAVRCISLLYSWISEKRIGRKNLKLARKVSPQAKKALSKLITIHCLERRWLIWFIVETEKDPNHYITYESVRNSKEFLGARNLLNLSILNRTGDEPLSWVFLHNELISLFHEEVKDNEGLSHELDQERDCINHQGRQALNDDLPHYNVEMYFQSINRV